MWVVEECVNRRKKYCALDGMGCFAFFRMGCVMGYWISIENMEEKEVRMQQLAEFLSNAVFSTTDDGPRISRVG